MNKQRRFIVTNEKHFHFIELGFFSLCTFVVSVAVQLWFLNEEYKLLCSPTVFKRDEFVQIYLEHLLAMCISHVKG